MSSLNFFEAAPAEAPRLDSGGEEEALTRPPPPLQASDISLLADLAADGANGADPIDPMVKRMWMEKAAEELRTMDSGAAGRATPLVTASGNGAEEAAYHLYAAWRDMRADMSAATREAVDAGACLDLAAALGFEPARREREGLG